MANGKGNGNNDAGKLCPRCGKTVRPSGKMMCVQCDGDCDRAIASSYSATGGVLDPFEWFLRACDHRRDGLVKALDIENEKFEILNREVPQLVECEISSKPELVDLKKKRPNAFQMIREGIHAKIWKREMHGDAIFAQRESLKQEVETHDEAVRQIVAANPRSKKASEQTQSVEDAVDRTLESAAAVH